MIINQSNSLTNISIRTSLEIKNIRPQNAANPYSHAHHSSFKLTDLLSSYNNWSFQKKLMSMPSLFRKTAPKKQEFLPYQTHQMWKCCFNKIKPKLMNERRPTTVEDTSICSKLESPVNLSCSSIKLNHKFGLSQKKFSYTGEYGNLANIPRRKIIVYLRPKTTAKLQDIRPNTCIKGGNARYIKNYSPIKSIGLL